MSDHIAPMFAGLALQVVQMPAIPIYSGNRRDLCHWQFGWDLHLIADILSSSVDSACHLDSSIPVAVYTVP